MGLSFLFIASAVVVAAPLPGCGADPESAGSPPVVSTGVVADVPSAAKTRTLVCEEPQIDFGQIWEGAVLEHRFQFVATGGAPTAIEAVRADCGCTVAELEIESPAAGSERVAYGYGDPIVPGARVFVHVTYDTRGKRGRAPRTISLYTPEGRAEVVVTADVVPWLRVEPERSDLPILRESEQAETSFHIASVDGTPFKLWHVPKAVPSEVRADVQPVAPNDDGLAFEWDVRVTFGPGMPRGPHIYPIELWTDQLLPDLGANGVRPAIKATPYVTIQVVGAVSLSPPTILFGVVDPAETVARTVRVLCHDPDFSLPEPVAKLVSIRPSQEDFALGETASISVRQVPGQNAWDVQLLLSGLRPTVQGTFLGKLVIETGHPGDPRIEANVSGVALVGGMAGGAQ